MVQLVFSIFKFSSLVPLLRFSLLNALFHFVKFRIKLSDNVFALIFLQLDCFGLDLCNVLVEFFLENLDNLFVFDPCVLFVAQPDSELSLQLVNFLPETLFPCLVPVLTLHNILVQSLVCLLLIGQLFAQLLVPLIPVVCLDVLGISSINYTNN